MKTLVAVIKKMGAEDYKVDLRNKASHELCREIVCTKVLDNVYLPMV